MAHRCAGVTHTGQPCQVVLARGSDCGRHGSAGGRPLPAGMVRTAHGTLVSAPPVSVVAADPFGGAGGGTSTPTRTVPADVSRYVPTVASADTTVGPPADGAAADSRLLLARPDQVVSRVSSLRGFDNGEGWVPDGPSWVQVSDPRRWSGHKLHVACSDHRDVAEVAERVHGLVGERGIGMKAAARHLVEPPANLADRRLARQLEANPVAKGVTLYLPRRATLNHDTTAVARALDGYRCERPISGDTPLGGALYHRYEFSSDPGYDVTDFREYHRLYRRA